MIKKVMKIVKMFLRFLKLDKYLNKIKNDYLFKRINVSKSSENSRYYN